MLNKIKNIMVWTKTSGKILYIMFVIELIVALVIASVITWNKNYAVGKSMFQLQTPLFLLAGLGSFCTLDCFGFIGRFYERQIMKTILSSDPLFFLKRYMFFGVIFILFSLMISGLMNFNSNVNINWQFYVTLIVLLMFYVMFYAGVTTLVFIINKDWICKFLLLLLLLQTLASVITLYPFFVDNINPWIINSLGVIMLVFTAMSAFNESTGLHISLLIPMVIWAVILFSILLTFHIQIKWNTKLLF